MSNERSHVLNVGKKHSGKRFADIYNTDPAYVDWAINTGSDSKLLDFISYCAKRRVREMGLTSDSKFDGGPYHDASYEDIVIYNPGNCMCYMAANINRFNPGNEIRNLRLWLLAYHIDLLNVSSDTTEKMTVGKYKGFTYQEVFDKHPDYVGTILKLKEQKVNKELLPLVEWIKGNSELWDKLTIYGMSFEEFESDDSLNSVLKNPTNIIESIYHEWYYGTYYGAIIADRT